ncbi:hypothetical protein [Leptolyngbya ohadii]
MDLDAQDQILHARLAYGGVAATPVRAIAGGNALPLSGAVSPRQGKDYPN